MSKRISTFLSVIVAIFVIAQLIRPGKNTSNEHPAHVFEKYPASDEVKGILQRACNDCHSNNTVYPWYASIQPVASWLAHHIEEGKEHLNFSAFTARRIAVQNHKFEEIIEVVKEGEMPMGSYTLIHRDAILSDAEKAALTQWAQTSMDSISAHYPADSLVLKRR